MESQRAAASRGLGTIHRENARGLRELAGFEICRRTWARRRCDRSHGIARDPVSGPGSRDAKTSSYPAGFGNDMTRRLSYPGVEKTMIRIANGQGFWGDWLEAPVRLIEQGPIDYLVLDYLAEITMSILQKQREADPSLGYARDFPPLIGRIAKRMVERNVRVIANAGGVNPVSCAEAVRKAAPGIKVAVVLGDDVLGRIDEFLGKGYRMADMDTGLPLETIREKIQSANAYIGAFPLAEALSTGAQVVIAGRSTDTALALAPMVHHFGWSDTDWDKLAAGTIAGHIIECGAQCTGGNCQVDWQNIPNMADIGYPIVEAAPDST